MNCDGTYSYAYSVFWRLPKNEYSNCGIQQCRRFFRNLAEDVVRKDEEKVQGEHEKHLLYCNVMQHESNQCNASLHALEASTCKR